MPLLSLLSHHGVGEGFEWVESGRSLIRQFDSLVRDICEGEQIRLAVVRSQLDCSVLFFADRSTVWIVGQKAQGMGSARFGSSSLDEEMSIDEVMDVAVYDFGMDDPFIISIPRELLDMTDEAREDRLRDRAQEWVEAESTRTERQAQIVRIKPLFGHADFMRNPTSCFVLMPFSAELDQVYLDIIKPTVLSSGLSCRRADEIVGNRAVMADIWKSICESRLIIADLTGRNPNVYYELGIAHTVGKESILITQREEGKFPFDVAHIRRIQYENTAAGGMRLKTELERTISEILRPTVRSDN